MKTFYATGMLNRWTRFLGAMPLIALMMVSAFAGYDFLMEAYRIAVEKKYKFFTYGNPMLII